MPADEDGPGYPALAVLVRARMNPYRCPASPQRRTRTTMSTV